MMKNKFNKLKKLGKLKSTKQTDKSQPQKGKPPQQIRDERFSFMYEDPRFKLVPQNVKKTKIDKRFQHMFQDDRFKIVAKTDKYGRELPVERGVN